MTYQIAINAPSVIDEGAIRSPAGEVAGKFLVHSNHNQREIAHLKRPQHE
jgi:hypothetical protein